MGREETAPVVVVGGGAAGLLAGIAAARAGAGTLVLERMARPGRKLAVTGGGRCNLGNTLPPRDFVRRFGDPHAALLGRALAALPGPAVLDLLAGHGLETVVEAGWQLFPRSGRAEDVVAALTAELAAAGAELRTGNRVAGLRPSPAGFHLTVAGGGELAARTVVLCTGGVSWPQTGSSGDGHRLAAALGHEVTPLRPGLVGLETRAEWPRRLAGLVLPDAALTLERDPIEGKPLGQARGELLFTHFGLSGPAVLDLANDLAWAGNPPARLVADLLPELTAAQAAAGLDEACRLHPRRTPARALAGLLPGRLLAALLPGEGPAGELRREARREAVARLKGLDLEVAGPREIRHAEVTVGGVAWAGIDPATLESRLHPGLFFAGELLDVAGRCGGFNLQAAFATGFLAGQSAGRRTRETA